VLTSLNSIGNDFDIHKRGKHVSKPWLAIAQNHITKSGGKISLDRAEADDKADVAEMEDIGWIAVQTGTGSDVKAIHKRKLGSKKRPKRIGFEDAQKGKKAELSRAYPSSVAVLGKSSRRGNNGGWVRIYKESPSKVQVVIDEDRTLDPERQHIREDISMVEFKNAFTDCISPPCCTTENNCATAATTAENKANIFANKEKQIANIKAAIANLQEKIQISEAKKAEREAKREQNEAAQELLDLRRQECATAFPSKTKIGSVPSDMSSALEKFTGVTSWHHCRLKCCIPPENSPSVECTAIIYDADAEACWTMGGGYVASTTLVPNSPPVFTGAYDRASGAGVAS